MRADRRRAILERKAEKRKGLVLNFHKLKDEKILAKKAKREKAKHIFW